MAVTIADARAGLATLLDTISGLRIYTYPPDSVNELPCAFISIEPTSINYNPTMGSGGYQGVFLVTVLLSTASTISKAQALMDDYLSPSGTKSIKAIVESDKTLGGSVHTLWFEGVDKYGLVEYAGGVYLGCVWKIRVAAHD